VKGKSRTIALWSLTIAAMLAVGCTRSGALERAGVAVRPPPSWRPVAPNTSKVPGVALAEWVGPNGSALMLYRTLPEPGGSPARISEALANRFENLPGLRVLVHQTERVGDTTAARVEVVAPGTGDMLAPSGAGTPMAPAGKTLIPTREVIFGFHRPDATLFLTWVTPESSYDKIAPDIKATLETVRFISGGKPTFYGY
jgi:hypothetical protein